MAFIRFETGDAFDTESNQLISKDGSIHLGTADDIGDWHFETGDTVASDGTFEVTADGHTVYPVTTSNAQAPEKKSAVPLLIGLAAAWFFLSKKR